MNTERVLISFEINHWGFEGQDHRHEQELMNPCSRHPSPIIKLAESWNPIARVTSGHAIVWLNGHTTILNHITSWCEWYHWIVSIMIIMICGFHYDQKILLWSSIQSIMIPQQLFKTSMRALWSRSVILLHSRSADHEDDDSSWTWEWTFLTKSQHLSQVACLCSIQFLIC